MNNDFLKGSVRKPIANKIPMGSPRPGTARVDEGDLALTYERGYTKGYQEGSTEVEDSDQAYNKGKQDGYNEAVAKGGLSQREVLNLLESDDYSTKHGKTIAKALREEWGL